MQELASLIGHLDSVGGLEWCGMEWNDELHILTK